MSFFPPPTASPQPPQQNFLLQALQRQQLLTNPFAPKPQPIQAPTGFGIPPASAMNVQGQAQAPSSPQASAPVQNSVPPPASPPVPGAPSPADQLTAANARYQAALGQQAAFQPYQEQQIGFTPPPVSANPKGDAVKAGVELLGAALLPNYGSAIGQTMGAEKELRDKEYARKLDEERTKFETASADEARKTRNSLTQQGQLEKQVESAQRGVESAQRGVEAASALEEKRQKDQSAEAIAKVRADAYASRVINQNRNDEKKIAETAKYHAETIGVRNSAIASSIERTKIANAAALQRANIHAANALQIADQRANLAYGLEYLKEHSRKLMQENAQEFRASYGATTALLNSYTKTINQAGSALASPEAKMRAQQLVQPGADGSASPYEQIVDRLKRLGANVQPGQDVQDVQAYQSQAHDEYMSGTLAPEIPEALAGAVAPPNVTVNAPAAPAPNMPPIVVNGGGNDAATAAALQGLTGAISQLEKNRQPQQPPGSQVSPLEVANLTVERYQNMHAGEPFDAAWGALSNDLRQNGATPADLHAAEEALRAHIAQEQKQNQFRQNAQAAESGRRNVAAQTAEARGLQHENAALTPQQAHRIAQRPNQELLLAEPGSVITGILQDGKPNAAQRALAHLVHRGTPLPQAQALVQRLQASLSAPPIPYQSGFGSAFGAF